MTRPTIWPVFVSFGIAFALLVGINVAAGVVLVAILGSSERVTEVILTLWGLSLAAALSVVVLSAVAVVGAVFSGIPIRDRLVLGPIEGSRLAVAAACLASICLSIAFGLASDLLGFKDAGILAKITEAVERSGTPAFLLSLACLAIGPAVGEELYFRGFVQARLQARWGPAPAVALSSLLFGLFHFDLKQSVFAALAGVLLGWVAHRARSTRAAMVVHAVNNATSLILAKLAIAPERAGPRALVFGGFLALAAVLASLAAVRFRAHSRR